MLYEPKPGIVTCLGGCDKKFKSRDVRTNRICPNCARKRDRDYMPRSASLVIEVNGKRVFLHED